MLLYVLELTTAIPFSLVFRRFASLQFSWFSILQLQDCQPAFPATLTFVPYINVWWTTWARIQFKILTLIFKAQRGLAPKYLADVILRPHSASSNRPLRSLNRHDHVAEQSRSFASIGPSLCNALSPSVLSTFLLDSLSSSFASLTIYFSRGLAHWQPFRTVHPTIEHCLNTTLVCVSRERGKTRGT